MAGRLGLVSLAVVAALALGVTAACAANSGSSTALDAITVGTQTQRGFINDNVYHSQTAGDIHYSSYIPASYDGSEPYALFITLPGWEGLYFQGVGANMVEDFGTESIQYNDKMIVLSTQLNDWGETSARQAIALTEYFISHYNIDPAEYNAMADMAKAQRDNDERPALKSKIENLADYDIEIYNVFEYTE